MTTEDLKDLFIDLNKTIETKCNLKIYCVLFLVYIGSKLSIYAMFYFIARDSLENAKV